MQINYHSFSTPLVQKEKVKYHIVGNFQGRKLFVNFVVLCLFAKVFSMKFGGGVSFGTAQVSNL